LGLLICGQKKTKTDKGSKSQKKISKKDTFRKFLWDNFCPFKDKISQNQDTSKEIKRFVESTKRVQNEKKTKQQIRENTSDYVMSFRITFITCSLLTAIKSPVVS